MRLKPIGKKRSISLLGYRDPSSIFCAQQCPNNRIWSTIDPSFHYAWKATQRIFHFSRIHFGAPDVYEIALPSQYPKTERRLAKNFNAVPGGIPIVAPSVRAKVREQLPRNKDLPVLNSNFPYQTRMYRKHIAIGNEQGTRFS
jgi:hypothetical protein